MTRWMDLHSPILAPIITAWHSPGSAFVVLPIIIIAYLLDKWPAFNSRYVPVVCLFLGAALYPLFTPLSAVPQNFPVPFAVLVMDGFVLGFLAWVSHALVIERLIDFIRSKAKSLPGGPTDGTPPTPPPPPSGGATGTPTTTDENKP